MSNMIQKNNSAKILVIDSAMVSHAPYVSMYLDILNECGVAYDVICWNRKNDDISNIPPNFYIYDHPTDDHYPPLKKFTEIYKFYRFSRDIIQRGNYTKIIIFEIANAILFYRLLKKKFNNRYVFDIRDYSPFCKLKIANVVLNRFIENSYKTVISSKGFLKWLPKNNDYLISHNINRDLLSDYKQIEYLSFRSPIRLLTIGSLRDTYANTKFLTSFGNDPQYYMNFVGDGFALQDLIQSSRDNAISNVEFYGRYNKQDEVSFYQQADMINCCMNNSMTSRFLMSNRIYLATLLRKPIICLAGSYQSDVVKYYNLGIVVGTDDIKTEVNKYIGIFDEEKFCQGCIDFLRVVEYEQNRYIEEIQRFIEI